MRMIYDAQDTRPLDLPEPAGQRAAQGLAALIRRWVPGLLVAALAAVWGFDFGQRVSGPLLGLMAAINAAVMAVLLLDGLLSFGRSLRQRVLGSR